MIATPQLWLPERLRQRREDERLMKVVGLGGLQRRWMPQNPCCCGGEGCYHCTGSYPAEQSVRFEGITAGMLYGTPVCTPCEDFWDGSTFALSLSAGTSAPTCMWLYQSADGDLDCDGTFSCTVLSFSIAMSFFGEAGAWGVSVVVAYYCESGGAPSGSFHYRTATQATQLACKQVTELEVPYYGSGTNQVPCLYSASSAFVTSV